MEIIDDIRGPNGQLLIGAGVVLSDKHIRILKTWGVHTIAILGDDETTEEVVVSEELYKSIEAELKPYFVHANLENPIINYLFAESIKREAHNQLKNSDEV